MTIDLSVIYRKALRMFPLRVRLAMFVGIVLAEAAKGCVTLGNQFDAFGPGKQIDVAKLEYYQWWAIGIIAAVGVAAAWHAFTQVVLKQVDPYEEGEKNVKFIKLIMEEAGLSKVQTKLVWNAVAKRMADEIKVGTVLTRANLEGFTQQAIIETRPAAERGAGE
ncbi:hypothetical protein [Paracraurococcus lichenis]|uniref:Uncharacterized protein n=1 Tax=Paracraurococcus lichenis TaxID=3064888 RepID=A0ABT9E7Q0_9PROT|nr:hypothetical protein [Paracraurococcus sp. LOR1-02]MDO9711983.1 hypothetical protein [Paracraurococcus sp. LOR1-02]